VQTEHFPPLWKKRHRKRWPESERVLVVSPCSGHGFKHSAAIGEAVSQRLLDGASCIDLSSFGFGRFDSRSA